MATKLRRISTRSKQNDDPAPSVTSAPSPTSDPSPNAAGPMILETLSTITFGPRNAFPMYVPVSDLHNATDNGLSKLKSRTLARFKRRVYIESAASSRSDNLFYVPLPNQVSPSSSSADTVDDPSPVQYAAVAPSREAKHIVLATDDFEVALVGMHTVPQDGGFGNGSELLLYSVRDIESPNARRADNAEPTEAREPRGSRDSRHSRRRNRDDSRVRRGRSASPSNHSKDSSSRERKGRPRALLNPADDAKIHYDPVVDGHDQGTSPNTYVCVPGRKGLLLQHRGKLDAHVDIVEARFTVVEVDAVTSSQRRGVEKAGEVLTGTVDAVPFGKFFSPALTGVTSLASTALDRFELPDHVISRDVMFRLLPKFPEDAPMPSNGTKHPLYADNYLRYGYYFFLGQKVDAKLYAQNDTSSQTVPLLLRRTGRRGMKRRLGEREFFPLTGVNYVVMKVTPGCLNGRTDRTPRQREHDRERLEEILKMKKAMDLLRGRV